MKELTEKQRKVLDFIENFQEEQGMAPTVAEISEYFGIKSESFVESTFKGSLPAFIAAFTKRKKLSEDEIVQIKSIIDKYGEE